MPAPRRRELLGLIAGGLVGGWAGLARAQTPADSLARVDSQLRTLAAALLRAADKPAPPFVRPTNWKLQSWAEKVSIPGPRGAPAVRGYLVAPSYSPTGPRAVILHIHGGGFIAGDLRMDLGNLHRLGQALDCVVLTVNYRLAPQTAFPGRWGTTTPRSPGSTVRPAG